MSTVLVYADDPEVRERVILALGTRPAADLEPVEFIEASEGRAVIDVLDHREAELCILDAEAAPSGGMGLSRQIHNEIADPPPVILLIGRRDDRWLATWSMADAVVTHPIDPAELAATVVALLRARPVAVVAARGGEPGAGHA
jgi:DNA-binding response OmpR family regulator